jgi:hypothetical protein
MIEETKLCRKCDTIKPLGDFYRARNGKASGDKLVYKTPCKSCQSGLARNWQLANPERTKRQKKAWRLRTDYGITIEEYEARLTAQSGRCAICGLDESRSNLGNGNFMLSVDHCHDSGAIRGLLCNNCNRAIGMLGDDPEILKRAIQYLVEGSGSNR